MLIDKSRVKRILVITLSNMGDVILTTPVIRALDRKFPASRMDVMVGPGGRGVFDEDPRISKVIIYDKHLPIAEKRRLQLKLKKLKYDLVVDLRNTIFPLLIGPRYRTATIQRFPKKVMHSKERHLYRLKSLGIDSPEASSYIHIPKADDDYVEGLLKREGVARPFVVINAGAKSHLKRWTQEGFAACADRLIEECGVDVVLVGLTEDKDVVEGVINRMRKTPYNLTNKTNIRQLAALLKRAKLVITNDSAPLHLACAVGTKVLAIFGPTNPLRYGPDGEFDEVINKKLSCAPCEVATCNFNYECMKLISPEEVFETSRMMLEGYE